jgi:dynein heavy chain
MQAQQIVDGKLDRRRMGVFGPPPGRKSIVFVDDLNMPAREKYGAQPPVELLRQALCHDGWYDVKTCRLRMLADVHFCCAMGPPGGGRNPVTNRFVRHFNVLCFPELTDSGMKSIFSTILKDFFIRNEFGESLGPSQALADRLTSATVSVYRQVLAQMRPVPGRDHYTYVFLCLPHARAQPSAISE